MSATKTQNHDTIEAGMRTKTHKISWLNIPGYIPETWNPIIGCSKVSTGCENCYALAMAKRIAGMERAKDEFNYRLVLMPDKDNKQSEWNSHTILLHERLSMPSKWKKPRAIFVCSMGDLFHEHSDFEKIDAVFSVMSDNDQHLYILLTKRPEVAKRFFEWKTQQNDIEWQPKNNIWLGVTAENQEQANKRIPILLDIPAAISFVSIEPMLGPIDLKSINEGIGLISDSLAGEALSLEEKYYDGPKLNWVIVGGETGPKARPMYTDWVRSIRDQCKESGTPFFFKQWGRWSPEGTIKNYKWLMPYEKVSGIDVLTTKPCIRNIDLLDGQNYHEFPSTL